MKSVDTDNILDFIGMRPVSKEGLLSLKPSVVIVAQANKKHLSLISSSLISYIVNMVLRLLGLMRLG